MKDRIFLDSNILVHSSLEDDENKHSKVIGLLENIRGNKIFAPRSHALPVCRCTGRRGNGNLWRTMNG